MSLGNVNKFVKGDHFCTKHFNHIVQSIAGLRYKYIASIIQTKDIKDKRSTNFCELCFAEEMVERYG